MAPCLSRCQAGERILASVGRGVRRCRSWVPRIRQETKSSCAFRVWSITHDISLFRVEYRTPCIDWGIADSCLLLHQDLIPGGNGVVTDEQYNPMCLSTRLGARSPKLENDE